MNAVDEDMIGSRSFNASHQHASETVARFNMFGTHEKHADARTRSHRIKHDKGNYNGLTE